MSLRDLHRSGYICEFRDSGYSDQMAVINTISRHNHLWLLLLLPDIPYNYLAVNGLCEDLTFCSVVSKQLFHLDSNYLCKNVGILVYPV